jgi:hypothetical protein
MWHSPRADSAWCRSYPSVLHGNLGHGSDGVVSLTRTFNRINAHMALRARVKRRPLNRPDVFQALQSLETCLVRSCPCARQGFIHGFCTKGASGKRDDNEEGRVLRMTESSLTTSNGRRPSLLEKPIRWSTLGATPPGFTLDFVPREGHLASRATRTTVSGSPQPELRARFDEDPILANGAAPASSLALGRWPCGSRARLVRCRPMRERHLR